MLTVESLDVAYGRAQVLFGVIAAGARPAALVCVMGRNGVGKTTLLKAIMGVLPARAGRGRSSTVRTSPGCRTHERVRLGLGYVPQGHETFPQLTVCGEPARRPGGGDRGRRRWTRRWTSSRRCAACCAAGPGSSPAASSSSWRSPGRWSTGPGCCCSTSRPRASSRRSSWRSRRRSHRLHTQAGLAILLVEQYLELALRLADQYVILDAGEVVRAGDREDLRDASVHRLLAV